MPKLKDTHWLVLDYSPIDSSIGSERIKGLIFNFKDTTLVVSSVFTDKRRPIEYEVTGQTLVLADSLPFELFHLSKDSLVLKGFPDDNTLATFLQLHSTNALSKEFPYWEHPYWELSMPDYLRELEFRQDSFRFRSTFKVCYQKDKINGYNVYYNEGWNNVSINGNQLLVKSLYEVDLEYFRITAVHGDSLLELERLDRPDLLVTLKKLPLIDKRLLEERKEIIGGKLWKSIQTVRIDTISKGFGWLSQSEPKYSSLLHNKLSFRFDPDGRYGFFDGDQPFEEGEWRLSSTGNQILLRTYGKPLLFMDIISIQPEELELGQIRWFNSDTLYDGLDKELYFQLRLRR